eukprot:CAMPEP_0168458834 /NCGR_PEP_ID=MMETSP0228-20121227/52594_1 /TAXON_ID=133427 /ORGANISM="Protoceratium reticulatum, Strain CCCM 535 (=CCMP 1889)" /LENGTH=128 /DNA_ID=CAMNT_0008473971 /DNA_START=74 /DNA_END=463 /DNA_ORIENTATION=+
MSTDRRARDEEDCLQDLAEHEEDQERPHRLEEAAGEVDEDRLVVQEGERQPNLKDHPFFRAVSMVPAASAMLSMPAAASQPLVGMAWAAGAAAPNAAAGGALAAAETRIGHLAAAPRRAATKLWNRLC